MAGSAACRFGIYVHVPYCRVRCPYCAFNVHVDRGDPWPGWAAGVRRDWARAAARFPAEVGAESVYFGGGTPSLAPPDALAAVLEALPRQPGAEVTVEVNPGTLDASRLDALLALGVTRLSLGIQTFNPRFARLLNRGHSVRDARALAERVAGSGVRTWSVDVIFALPGQSLADVQVDLDAILALRPPHVSLYGLTFEEGTPFARAAEAGRLRPPGERAWRAQYDAITRTLLAAGFERYEVSNFALPGHRSMHNEAIWRGGAYAGLGPGAHGFEPDGSRTVQPSLPEAWLEASGPARERPTPREAAVDLVLGTLRHVDGLPLPLLRARTGHTVDPVPLAEMSGAPRRGAGARPRRPLLRWADDRLALTPAGFPLADGLIRRVCDALRVLPRA